MKLGLWIRTDYNSWTKPFCCKQVPSRRKREHQQIGRRLSDEIERKEVLLAQLDYPREEARELKSMVFQHAGCENQQIDLQLARMMRNILNDPSKDALPIYEADKLPALSCEMLSGDSAVSDQQPDAINADSNNKMVDSFFSISSMVWRPPIWRYIPIPCLSECGTYICVEQHFSLVLFRNRCGIDFGLVIGMVKIYFPFRLRHFHMFELRDN